MERVYNFSPGGQPCCPLRCWRGRRRSCESGIPAPFGGGGGILGIPGTPGFGAGTKSSQVTFGGDVIAKF
jgi:hypothetical protein